MTSSVFNYHVVDGFCMTHSYMKNRHLLDEFEVYDEDVWIAGSPKTGTTWIQEMIWLMVNDLDYEGAKVSVNRRVPLWEQSEVMDLRPVASERNFDLPLFRADALKYIKDNKINGRPMCIKTHMPFNLLPRQIREGTRKPKIIFTSRNPKDTCISMFHFKKNLVAVDESLDNSAQGYLEGDILYGPQWDHTITYWNERHRSNILILKYEEMVQNLPEILRKVAHFLEKTFTDTQLDELADHLSFDKMKANPAVNYKEMYEIFRQLGLNKGGGQFLRSGKVGSFKDEMSEETIAKFDKLLLEKSKQSGWNFV